MVGDFEDLYDLENLDDDQIHDLIIEELEEYGDIDVDLLEIDVLDGFVTLSGQVGTEYELQVVENVLTDILGIANYSNEIVIGGLVRFEQSEAADEAHFEMQAADEDSQFGGSPDETEPSASHLLEDTQSEQDGTQDMMRAIEEGEAYEPPDRPIQEGYWSEEDH